MTGEIIGRVTWRKVAQRPGAVDLGRVVQLGRDALQAGQEDQHHVADPPQAHERRATGGPSAALLSQSGLGMPTASEAHS